jgi:endo-1,3(4)-beta-glucanase
MGYAPWSPTNMNVKSLPAAALSVIQSTLATEIGADFIAQTNLATVYFSGKGLAKVASLVYLASDLAKNEALLASGLQKLKDSFAIWVNNKAASTLVYDTTWKGVVSSAGWTDPGADYGATYYNDHMFHYGYFVYAASVIASLDPTWLTNGTNKAYVNSLVRDYANSITDDAYFPFSRCFDWYHGHSWASGLFAAGDGKSK